MDCGTQASDLEAHGTDVPLGQNSKQKTFYWTKIPLSSVGLEHRWLIRSSHCDRGQASGLVVLQYVPSHTIPEIHCIF